MMTLDQVWRFGLVVMTVYRLALLIATETGPFALARSFRVAVQRRFLPTNYQPHWIDEGVNCPWCISFWLSLVLTWFITTNSVVDYLFTGLGVAGTVVLLYQAFHSQRGR